MTCPRRTIGRRGWGSICVWMFLAAAPWAYATPADEVVVDFERAEIGVWLEGWEEQGVRFQLAWEPKQTKAPGRVTFFPHLASGRKGILCAMADEPIPVLAVLPRTATEVTVVFWASNGSAAVLEAFDAAGNVVDAAKLDVVPQRAAPGDSVPFFELTVRAPAIASIQFRGPRSGEFLAADEVRINQAAVTPSAGGNTRGIDAGQ